MVQLIDRTQAAHCKVHCSFRIGGGARALLHVRSKEPRAIITCESGHGCRRPFILFLCLLTQRVSDSIQRLRGLFEMRAQSMREEISAVRLLLIQTT